MEHYPYLAANSRSARQDDVHLLEVYEICCPNSVFTKTSHWEAPWVRLIQYTSCFFKITLHQRIVLRLFVLRFFALTLLKIYITSYNFRLHACSLMSFGWFISIYLRLFLSEYNLLCTHFLIYTHFFKKHN